MKEIGERLRYLRTQNNLTQKEMALKLQLSPSTIGMYEQNRRSPDIETIEKISTLFGISIADILDIENAVLNCSEITKRILLLASRSKKNINDLKPHLKTDILSGYVSDLDLFLRDVYIIADFYGVSDEYILGGIEFKQNPTDFIDPYAKKFLDAFSKLNEDNRDIIIGKMKDLLREQRLETSVAAEPLKTGTTNQAK